MSLPPPLPPHPPASTTTTGTGAPPIPPLPASYRSDYEHQQHQHPYESPPHFADPLVAPRPHKLDPHLPANVSSLSLLSLFLLSYPHLDTLLFILFLGGKAVHVKGSNRIV